MPTIHELALVTEEAAAANAPAQYDASNHSLVLFDRGDEIVVQSGDEGIRFLLVSGKPIEEPFAWYGPHRYEHARGTSTSDV